MKLAHQFIGGFNAPRILVPAGTDEWGSRPEDDLLGIACIKQYSLSGLNCMWGTSTHRLNPWAIPRRPYGAVLMGIGKSEVCRQSIAQSNLEIHFSCQKVLLARPSTRWNEKNKYQR